MTTILAELQGRTDRMVDDLATIVAIESPSEDLAATARCARAVAELGIDLLGTAPSEMVVDGRTHLHWDFGSDPKVILLGHLDTVWPLGTVARWPFAVSEGIASGPGCFDMKGGVVQLLHAASVLNDRSQIAILLTTDEEIGSPSSRGLIEKVATGARAVLVCEPSADGALKTERKGAARYRMTITGRAAHAGLDPEKGANATHAAALVIVAITALGDADRGTTVTPTLLRSGTAVNTVPAEAILYVDVRARSVAEQERVEAALEALESAIPGTVLNLEREGITPPLERTSSSELFARATRIATDLGMPALREASVGGASDGNFTAAMGVPTLDGLGPVGGGAHAEGEHLVVGAMTERAALVAALADEIAQERHT